MEKKPLKILYTASTDGHFRSFHLPYLAALCRGGHSVTAAARGDGHGLPEGITFTDVPFTKSFVSVQNLRAARMLSELMRRERYDVIIAHTSLAAFFTRLAVRLAGKGESTVINTVHGYLFDDMTPLPKRMMMLEAEKLMAGVTDTVLTMNETDRVIAERHRLAERVIPIDGMGVPLDRFSPASGEEKREARRRLAIPEGALVLLYAAEFSKRKNQLFLIDAMTKLPADCILLLPGQGELWEDCRARAAELGLSDRVLLPGFSDMREMLAAADVCVSSSRSEGLPFHVMEAMGAALPCVLTRVKGHEDLLPGERAGFLYPFNDADAFASAVEKLHDDAALRKEMGEFARESVQRYSLDRVLPGLLSLFQGQ